MAFLQKLIFWSYCALFAIVPLIFLPWTSELFEFNKIIVTLIIAVIIVSAWAVRCILEKKFIFRRTPLDIFLVLHLFVLLISTIFSIDPISSIYGYYGRWNGGLISIIAYTLLYWAFVSNISKKQAQSILYTAVFTASLVAIYGILEHFGIDEHVWVQDVKNRVFSTIGQPNWLAAYLIPLLFTPIAFTLTSKNKNVRLLHISMWTILFLCLIYTKSRSGIIAFTISFIVFSFLYFWKNKLSDKISIKYLLLFAGVAFTLTLLIKNPVRDFALSKFGITSQAEKITGPALEQGGTESGSIRKIVWTGAIRAWQESTKTILIGHGPETFAPAYYKYRPIEHNQTSEWELLYNKAHNEFLNYLTTTGLVGLISYLSLLTSMFIVLLKYSLKNENRQLKIALLSGWISIPMTNFLGFSVVPVQLLMFLLPAFAVTLSLEDIKHSPSKIKLSTVQIIGIVLILLPSTYILISIARYWLADIYFAKASKYESAFSSSQDPQSIADGFATINKAYDLNSNESSIASELGSLSGYMALLTKELDATTSAELEQLAFSASSRAISLSPYHPSNYKSHSRTLILLSAVDEKYLDQADQALQTAQLLSPTDPRIYFNRAVIAKYQGNTPKAKQLLESSLELKPDFGEAQAQLDQLASPSAKNK